MLPSRQSREGSRSHPQGLGEILNRQVLLEEERDRRAKVTFLPEFDLLSHIGVYRNQMSKNSQCCESQERDGKGGGGILRSKRFDP